MYVYILSETVNGSRKLEVSRTCLSYEGRPDGLKASDSRLVSLHTSSPSFIYGFTITPCWTDPTKSHFDRISVTLHLHFVAKVKKNRHSKSICEELTG